jgi:3,5-dihydroxyphenylacetyl-CoA synthase
MLMSRPLVSVLRPPRPAIVSVGISNPPSRYTQQEVADFLGVPDGIARRFFSTAGVEARYLFLRPNGHGLPPPESQAELLQRHRRGALALGREAIAACLEAHGLETRDIEFLCCISSTGFMLPGLTAMYIRHLGFRTDCQRVDVVGMGCNAALNGLNAAASWSAAQPGRYALVVCCEVNSAVHVQDDRLVTALVNSLFGDGCAAILLRSDGGKSPGPELLGFASHIVPDAWNAISYQWSGVHNKFELFLDKDIPKVLGIHSPTPISALLEEFGLERRDVAHWLVHAGGRKVISAIGDANGLRPHDLRHTTRVLRECGNLSSATVVFSYAHLIDEGIAAPGDYGVMVTMGPGATVETALLRW